MRIIFMGTPDFAVPSLQGLIAAGHEIIAVYTQPPRKAGRGKRLLASDVQQAAESMGLEVRSPKSLKSPEAQAAFAALNADIAVVAAYGMLLPQAVLDRPKYGCINVHASLLPRWRGAAPIHRAVLAGDAQTGVTIMQMEAGLDTGPMLAKAATQIGSKTTGDLFGELALMGAQLLCEVVGDLPAFPAKAQEDAAATHAPKISKSEARIDWSCDAESIERQIRGFAPSPGAWFEMGGKRIKLHLAEIAKGFGDSDSGNNDTGSGDNGIGDTGNNGTGSGDTGSGDTGSGNTGSSRAGIEKPAPGTILDDSMTIFCGGQSGSALRPLILQPEGKSKTRLEDFLRGNPADRGTILS